MMNILLTGGSSFTGTWFAKELRARGHEVTATLQSAGSGYSGIRQQRLQLLASAGVHFVEATSFGSDGFFRTLESGSFDVVCHHAAQVTDYKSLDFDIGAAMQANTAGARRLMDHAASGKLKAVVLTGSVFEQDEGLGDQPLRAFSPYGVSKGLSWQVFRYWAERTGFPLHKFVIPNPFGPQEDPRFCAYLLQKWAKGETPEVGTPDYVRDNIHVSLLAQAYASFVEGAAGRTAALRCGPSGYMESQGQFAARFAAEIGRRLDLSTPVAFARQKDFPEPRVRLNTDPAAALQPGWDEGAAWDELAAYYRATYLAARA